MLLVKRATRSGSGISFPLSLTSADGFVLRLDVLDSLVSLTLVALQNVESVLLHYHCVKGLTVFALHKGHDILLDHFDEMFGYKLSIENHLVVGTQISGTTKISGDEVKDVLVVTVKVSGLFVKVVPHRLHFGFGAGRLNQLEGPLN